jgi:hypothetical protein
MRFQHVPHRLSLAGLLFAASAAAQEGPTTLEFSFTNPGARSMGLGGAFAALADDATAAFANPAGLVQLLEPEVSLEGRMWSYDTPFVSGGRASGAPTGIGLDTVSGPLFGTSSVDFSGLSFLSFVYPGNKWAVAVYRHRWAKFAVERELDSLFGIVEGELKRIEGIRATTELDVVNNGFVGAYEITNELSVGVGLVYYQARIEALSKEFRFEDDAMFEPNTFEPELLDTTYTLGGDDSGFALNTGFSWRPSPRWSFGGYYRQGPALTAGLTEIVGPANDEAPEGTIEAEASTPLELPSVYGLAAAYRALQGALTIGFEWDRVLYSAITDSFDEDVFDADEIWMSDGNELHAGAEYVFAVGKPVLALRFGVWHDPAHGLGSGPEADQFERAIFNGGKSQFHFSGGAGFVLEHVQLDFGFDLAELSDLVSISIVYRF